MHQGKLFLPISYIDSKTREILELFTTNGWVSLDTLKDLYLPKLDTPTVKKVLETDDIMHLNNFVFKSSVKDKIEDCLENTNFQRTYCKIQVLLEILPTEMVSQVKEQTYMHDLKQVLPSDIEVMVGKNEV